jgi:PAS domain S-box-containing protein
MGMNENVDKDELALREFYSIALAKNLSFVDKASSVLELGCKYLELRCGIISYVEGDRYTILHVYTASDEYKILSGDVFDLGITYCKFTLEQEKPVGFHHAAKTDIANHPSYEALKLEAYLGAPTYLNDELFGTVNFTSIEPRKNAFTDSEKYYLQLIAEWFSTQLDKHYKKEPSLQSYKDITARLEKSPLALIELSFDFEVVKWSESATAMLGWSEAQVMHKTPNQWPVIDEGNLEDLMQLLNRLKQCNDGGCAFYSNLTKSNGELISTEWFLSCAESENGQCKTIRAQILDITERVNIENELLHKNARYIDLYENAPDMYLSLDQAGNIISVNKMGNQLLGYNEAGLIGKPYWNLILKSDVRRIRRLISVAFLGDVDELEMEASILTRDNRVIRTHQKIRIIQAKKGMPRELRIIARDITERKRGQATRLQHMQQQRDEISQEVQHRVKNSLQAVIGLLTMNMDVNPELKPILTTSIAQVNTISVVNGLILDGKEDIDVVSLFESLVDASSQLFNYQINVTKNIATGVKAMLIGEEVIAVSLIFTELLINAFKHHSENTHGESYISISLDVTEAYTETTIVNTYNTLAETRLDSTHFGRSMIRSLLPPQGAEITQEQNESIYQVLLKVMDPILVNEVV